MKPEPGAGKEETARLFFAVDLDAGAREELAAVIDRLRKSVASNDRIGLAPKERKVRWTRPENLHITLKFLGDTSFDAIPRILETAAGVLSRERRVDCHIDDCGVFGSRRGPTIVRAAVNQGKAFQIVAGELDSALEKIGFEREQRSYFSHLTLARAESPRVVKAILEELERARLQVVFTAAEVTLFRSELGRGAPVYTPVSRLLLGSVGGVARGPGQPENDLFL